MKTILTGRCLRAGPSICVLLALVCTGWLFAQEPSMESKLEGFDGYMARLSTAHEKGGCHEL